MQIRTHPATKGKKSKTGTKDIVVSYCSQYINTYNIFVLNLNTKKLDFWHESYALFETELTGFLLENDDFLTLTKDGMFNISLRDNPNPRKIKDADGQKKKLHSIGSLNYLKIASDNHIRLMSSGSEIIISI